MPPKTRSENPTTVWSREQRNHRSELRSAHRECRRLQAEKEKLERALEEAFAALREEEMAHQATKASLNTAECFVLSVAKKLNKLVYSM